VPFALAVLVAARYAGRSDWPRWDAVAAAGVLITLLAGLGAARLLADPTVGWAWVAAGSLISAAGVWAGVPETGPALLAGGALTGLVATAALTRSHWAPAAGVGVAAVLGWAALSGAVGRPWAVLGGALCTGVAPWFAFRPLFPTPSRSRSPGPWLLGVHALLMVLAARWIGVVPHAGWGRVALVAAGGLAVAMVTRRQA
jgi:hypothetical protein